MKTEYIDRAIEPIIKEAAEYFPVISITGPRQSGKTTLLKHLFPDYLCLSLRDVDVRAHANSDPVAFLNQTTGGMFIDEVQLVPKLLEYIQGIVDNNPERKFLLSGSSNLDLLNKVSESLPGRAGVYELMPMSMQEIGEGIKEKSLTRFLLEGLYPSVASGKNLARLFYPSYVKTYIERDVRRLVNIQDQMKFVKFMKLCAGRIGSIFVASDISSELGIDNKTVDHWLSVLQASYIITMLPPYYENISKRLIKSPKLYFNDTGLACYLLDIESEKQLDNDKMRGALFENLIVTECIKGKINAGKEGNVFFYRDSHQNEVDILLKSEGEITALEIKSSMTYNTSFERTLKLLPEWIKTPIKTRAIVYAGSYENSAADIKLVNYNNLVTVL